MTPSKPQKFQSIAVRVEPAAVLARRRLEEENAEGAYLAIRAALDTFRILGPSRREDRPISECLKSVERALASDTVEFCWNGDTTCRVDGVAIASMLGAVIENAELNADAVLLVTVDGEAEPPVVDLAFDGPGSFPDTWFAGGIVPVSFEELRRHWTRHTVGGRLDRTPNGLACKLVGQREPEKNPDEQRAVFASVTEAERVLRLATSEGSDSVPNASIVQHVLDAIDEESPDREPADVCALLRGLMDDERGFELQCGESLPPIALRRDRLAASLERLCDLARPRLDAGAAVTIIAEYNVADRAIEMECSFPLAGHDVAWHAACLALERVVEELHQGMAVTDVADDECNVSLTIPDTIGAAINDWIPGFDALSQRSIQMLRLLKSGGQAPPEDLILGGILESELERWLLPKLEAAAAVNVAHDLEKGKHSPRLAKALGQIRRGKPKKEICAPPYAAEILGVYRSDERGRRAVGLDSIDAGEIDALLDGLSSEPMGYVTCLQLIVKIARGASS